MISIHFTYMDIPEYCHIVFCWVGTTGLKEKPFARFIAYMYMNVYTSTMLYFHILTVAVEAEKTREGTVLELGKLVIKSGYRFPFV